MEETFHQLLLRTYHAYKRRLRPLRMRTGLSEGQPKMLRLLSNRPCWLQRELADAYNIEPATVSRLLSNMEAQGLITRQIPPDNKRAIHVRITDKGHEKFMQFEVFRRQIDDQLFLGFSAQERERFLQDFNRVCANLEQVGDPSGAQPPDNGPSND